MDFVVFKLLSLLALLIVVVLAAAYVMWVIAKAKSTSSIPKDDDPYSSIDL
jgi:hypothetical protein